MRVGGVLLGLLAVALAAVVYLPVVGTYFFADDFVCMVNIVNLGFTRFVLQLFGGHILFARNAVFWLVYQVGGFDPRPYYAMAVLTHLLNVWLLYRVARAFTGNPVLACLGAALWGTSPLCIGTVGWYSVYGQEMVATFLLLALDRLARLPADGAPSGRQVLLWCALMLAGATSFGVGIGVAMAFPVAVLALRPATFGRRGLRLALLVFPFLIAGLYFGFRRLYPLIAPFPASETVLDNVATRNVVPILSMLWHLVGVGITGLIMGFRFVANDYPDGTAHVLVGITLAGLVAAFVAGDDAVRRQLVTLAVLCVASYALIALGRSNVYLMFKIEPWVAARQFRYHYVGIVPLALALTVILDQVARRLPVAAPIMLAAWLGFAAWGLYRAYYQVQDRPLIRSWVSKGLARIDAAVDAAPAGADVFIDNEEAPKVLLGPVLGHADFPGLAALFAITHEGNELRGRRLHFVEKRPYVYFNSRDPRVNRRLADLLVMADATGTPPRSKPQ